MCYNVSMREMGKGNRYAVVDLEATGTGIDAKIIQIGIVLIEEGKIVDTYSTDVNPRVPLDNHIKELTGITDSQLVQAPDFTEVAGEIYRRICDAIFVAHNVSFDANLLAENLFFEGYDLFTPRVDTVELSQLFFPTFEKYSLTHLSNELDLGLEQAHTALSDALATAHLFLKIQDKIRSLPKLVIEQIRLFADHLLFESRLVIDELYAQMTDEVSLDLEVVHGIALRKPKQSLPPRRLSSDFVTNIHLLGLQERALQTRFAQLIEKRLVDEKQVHFIQAQAGIGKTYGYLLPLLANTQENLLLIVPTKVLQEQIMSNEGKAIQQVFQQSICSIKSPSHFIKLDAFWRSLQHPEENRLLNVFKMQILVWLCETETGDMGELKQKYRYPAYFEQLAHDGKLEHSLFGEWDFWSRLQIVAKQSRLLITNHSYFLTHFRKQDSPMENRLLVIDEAQKLMLAAESVARSSWDLVSLIQLMQDKKEQSETLLKQRLYESTYFELQHIHHQLPSKGYWYLRKEQLHQIRQNILELGDAELQEWENFLNDYDEFWVEVKRDGEKRSTYLCASRDDLLEPAKWLPDTKIFCISATLEISQQVSLATLLGFSLVSYDKLPHQQSGQQLLLVPSDLPDILSWSREAHAAYLLQRLEEIRQVGFPVLVLFTSVSFLKLVSDLLDEKGVEHLAQHKHGLEDHLRRRFERGDCPLLLGTGSFWEGVDFSGHSNLIQVITRLPFEHPKDQFVRKVSRRLRIEGKSPFYDFNLPMMMLKLKQAFGRTQRHPDQRSVLILLDNRLQTKPYGQQVRTFLCKDYLVDSIPVDGLQRAIKEFLVKDE